MMQQAVDWLQEVEILFRCYIILLGARPGAQLASLIF